MIKTEVKMEVTNEAQFYALQDLLFNNGLYWGTLQVQINPKLRVVILSTIYLCIDEVLLEKLIFIVLMSNTLMTTFTQK
jgi:hypothetical protein